MTVALASLTDAQQEIRSTGVGASEIAAVVGLSPYKRPIDIYARKLRLVEDDEAGEPARWGLRLEEVIAGAYADEEGIDPRLLIQPGTLRHPKHPIVIATPDRIRLQHDVNPAHGLTPAHWERNVQIKTASSRVSHRWGAADDDVPEEYLAQVQYEMAVTGLGQTDLPVLIGGNEMRIYRIAADSELQATLIDAALRFWRDHIEKRVPPAVDGSDNWSKFLSRAFPRDERPLLPATDDARRLLDALAKARRAKELDEEMEAEAVNKLKAIIGDAAGIEGVCTWKATKAGTKTDWQALAEFLHAPAETVAKFTTTRPGYRRFLPKLKDIK